MKNVYFGWMNKIIYYLFILTLLIIVGLNVINSRGFETIEPHTPAFFNIKTLLIAIFIVGFLVILQKKILHILKHIPTRLVVIILLLWSVIIQLMVVRYFNVHPTWDFGVMVNESKNLVENGKLSGGYFIRYPNNILMVCILAFIGRIFSPELYIYQLFNIVVITFSQFLIFRITSKLAGIEVGKISLLISVFFFPYLFYAPIVYTDTFSLPFLLVPLTLLIKEKGHFRNNMLLVIVVSIIFSFGMLLKGSLIIFIIAYSIVLLLFSEGWKRTRFFMPVALLIITKLLFNFVIYDQGLLNKHDVERYSFPVSHWIMMGQNNTNFGKFSQADVDWTISLLEKMPKDKVTKIHLQELSNRFKERGIEGNIRFELHKLSHIWTDGTYYSLNKLKRFPLIPANFAHLVDYRSGYVIQSFARIEHLLIFAGILIFSYRFRKEKKELFTFFMLCTIGFFLFFLMWEGRSRYIVSLTPLFIIMSCMGYFGFIRSTSKKEQ